MEISYIGHACFRLRGREASVVIDPYGKTLGIPTQVPSKFAADILLITHDHPGHNNRGMVGGNPKVIDGPGEYEVKGVGIRAVASFHDADRGTQKGRNTMFAVTIDDVVVAHLGDLGHGLDEGQQDQLGTVDILLLPVGGGNGLSLTQAVAVANQIEPKVVIPMHYRHPGSRAQLEEPEHFAREMGLEGIEFQPKLAVSGRPSHDEMKVVFLEARAVVAAVGVE
ncbi:MAG: MBL fold metallo-hydrolase [Candidatus Dormibacteria bacterium]